MSQRRFAIPSPASLRVESGMVIVLPALGVSFLAFAVWLWERIVSRRERWANGRQQSSGLC